MARFSDNSKFTAAQRNFALACRQNPASLSIILVCFLINLLIMSTATILGLHGVRPNLFLHHHYLLNLAACGVIAYVTLIFLFMAMGVGQTFYLLSLTNHEEIVPHLKKHVLPLYNERPLRGVLIFVWSKFCRLFFLVGLALDGWIFTLFFFIMTLAVSWIFRNASRIEAANKLLKLSDEQVNV
jgi:hypothetical protein